jgi:hypothetical protein
MVIGNILWLFGIFYGTIDILQLGFRKNNVVPILLPYGIFYGYLVYFIAIWKCCGKLVYFHPFWNIVSRKLWQPRPGMKFGTFEFGVSDATF